MNNKVYEVITDKILEQLDKGNIPWRQTWTNPIPRNLVSKKTYRGGNLFFLYLVANAMGYSSPYFASFKQIKEKGGHVRKGEKGYPVYFSAPVKANKTDDEDDEMFWVLKYYTVFNLDQTEGIEKEDEDVEQVDSIKVAEQLVEDYKDRPGIILSLQNPGYSLTDDVIRIPNPKQFESKEEYFATLFHELVHSTGHEKRINRKLDPKYGSENYSKEELVAEFGAAFLCADAAIDNTLENSAAYIKGWSTRLKEDKSLFVKAASQAQRAVDYIKGVTYEK